MAEVVASKERVKWQQMLEMTFFSDDEQLVSDHNYLYKSLNIK